MGMWYICTMVYCSGIKKNEIMFAGKWMELENIMLSEVSQVQIVKGQRSKAKGEQWRE
jgi:outer membrane cobalamin receptor